MAEISNNQNDETIHILHVDDDPIILEVTKNLLENQGFKIQCSTSVDEALQKVESEHFDVIISDYQMPEKNGIDFLLELRKKSVNIPFIIFTGKGREEVAAKALNLGAYRYLNKAGNSETVYAELTAAVRQAAFQEKFENLLREKTRLNQILLDAMPCVALLLRPKTRKIVASNLAGKRSRAVSGKKCYSTWGQRNAPCPWCLAPKLWETGKAQHLEVEAGDVVWEAHWLPVSPDLYMHYAFDITERKKIENALKTSEKTHRELLNSMNDTAWVIGFDGKFIDVNDTAVKTIEYSREELCKMGPADIDATLSKENIIALVKGMVSDKKQVFETSHKTRSGKIIPVEISSSLVIYRGQQAVLSVARDITSRKMAEEALRKSEVRYRSLFENAFDGIMLTKPSGEILSANPQACRMLGMTEEEIKLAGRDGIVVQNIELKNALKERNQKGYVRANLTFKRKDGTTFIGEITSNTFLDADGTLSASLVIRDITERQEIEKALFKSEERHRIVSNLITDVAFSCIKKPDENYLIDWISGATEKIFGYSCNELSEMGCWKALVHPEDRHIFNENIAELKPGQSTVCELRVIDKNNHVRWLMVTAQATEENSALGKIYRLFGACRDISENKETQLALIKNELKFRTITDTAHDWIYWIKPNGQLIYMSPSCERITGYSAQEFNEDPELLKRIVIPDDYSLVYSHFVSSRPKDESTIEFRIKTKNGSIKWISHVCQPVFDENGTELGRTAANRDITEYKKQEATIIESERRWAATLSSIGDGVIVTDEKAKITFMNHTAEQITGWALREIKGESIQKVFRIVNEESRNSIKDPVTRVLQEGVIVGLANHTILLRKDGSEVPIDDSGAPIKDKTGRATGVVLIFRDITERRKTEKELVLSEQKYRNLFNNMINGYACCQILLDNTGLPVDFLYLEVNEAFEKLTGLRKQDVVGKKVTQAIPGIKQDNPELFYVYGQVALTGQPTHFEIFFKPLNIWFDISVFSPKQGYFVAIFENITEKKKSEIELIEKQKKIEETNEKLRVMGRLTRHDISNKVVGIQGYLHIAKNRLSRGQDISEYFEKIDTAIKNIHEIFDFERTYEKIGVEKIARLDVGRSIETAIALLPEKPDDIMISNRCHGLFIKADSLLSKLFYNLIENSIKHGKHVTTINIYCVESPEGISIIYTDNGIGISTEGKRRLFKEGYSTGGSSGYGLYLIKKIVEFYGWTITETGDKGVKFTITIQNNN